MAILPMRQTVIIKRGEELDEWGNVVPERTFTLNCRVDEGTSLQSYRSVGVTNSEIVTATARIIFDKIADIQETDTIVFTNELGQTFEKTPKEINVKRGIGGKPIMTEVIV